MGAHARTMEAHARAMKTWMEATEKNLEMVKIMEVAALDRAEHTRRIYVVALKF